MARQSAVQAGLALLAAVIAGTAVLGVAQSLYRKRSTEERRICCDEFNAIGYALLAYHDDNGGAWPPLSPEPWRLLWPERLLTSKGIHADCPSCPTRARLERGAPDASPNFWYLGYTITNEEEGLAFLEAYREAVLKGHVPTEDLPAPSGKGTAGGDRFLRLHRSAERVLRLEGDMDPAALAKAVSKIPVLIEAPGIHRGDVQVGGPDYGMVVFMDGHPEWVKYPGRFPMTERFIKALRALPNPEKR